MTKEQWEMIENRLRYPGGTVRLKIDGYNVALQTQFENKMKLAIAVYIDDKISMEYLKPESDTCKRFMCPVRKCSVTKKDIEKVTRSKKRQQELKEKYTYTYYVPYWSSFRRLKSHFIKTNTSIELVTKESDECGI